MYKLFKDAYNQINLLNNNRLFIENFKNNNLPKSKYLKLSKLVKFIHKNINIKYGDLKEELPEQIMAFLHIEKDDSVLEFGGNIGLASIQINKKLINPHNHYVIEPLTKVIHKLKTNRNMNNCKFKIFNGAISNIPLMQKDWLSKPIPFNGIPKGWFKIPTYSYTEFLEKTNFKFNVIVADCEGCLIPILQKYPDILKNVNKILLEHDFNNNEQYYNFFDIMKKNNFKIIDQMKKGEKYSPNINWKDGVRIDPIFVSVWKKF